MKICFRTEEVLHHGRNQWRRRVGNNQSQIINFLFIFVHVTVRIVRLKICVKLFQLLHLKASKEKCSQECEAIQKQVKSKNVIFVFI